MQDIRPPLSAYRFGPFRLNVTERILERDGERVPLTPKVIDTLIVLVENSGRVVTKEDLIKAVWSDVNVVESGLTRNISALRKALEEGHAEGTYIETIPKRGYRFVAGLTMEQQPAREAPKADAGTIAVAHSPAVAPRDSRRRWFALGIAILLGAGLVGYFAMPSRPRTAAIADPAVRIGEHLLYKLAPGETARAAEHFEQAIAEHPNSANAHAGLAVSLLYLSTFGVRPLTETLPRAEQAAKASIRLDPRSATAHYATAMVQLLKDWNFPAAEASFRRALDLEPESAQTRMGYAHLKWSLGDVAGAQRLLAESLQLDPASPLLGTEYCRSFYFQRDFRRAEAECRKVLDREPGFALAHYYLALSLGSLGRIAEAGKTLEKSGLSEGVLEADRAWLQLRNGNRQPAMAALESRRQLMREGNVDATAKLLLAAALGRMDEAYEALEVGLATRATELLEVHLDPRLDPIRSDPRYPSVLRRVGIPVR
jgi:DNA-binding winged helix-turn-helix (wHTH) protein/Tfp pilus assembly protein PilF